MKRRINPKTLEKYVAFYNELCSKRNFTFTEANDIKKKFEISASTITLAVKLGFFDRVKQGVYVANQQKLEPIQVRRIMEAITERNRQSEKNKKIAVTEDTNQPVNIEVVNEPNNTWVITDDNAPVVCEDVIKAVKKKRKKLSREFSLFWGLIKIKF